MQLTQSSGCKFQPHFCGLWCQCQFHFQSLCNALQVCPACVPPRGQSRMWVVVYLHLEFHLKAFSTLFRSDSHMCRLGWVQGFINNITRLLFQTLSSLQCPQYFLVPRVPFSVLQSEEKQKKKVGFIPFSLSIRRLIFCFLSQNQRVSPGAHLQFQATLCLDCTKLKQTTCKLTVGSEVLWTLVSFPIHLLLFTLQSPQIAAPCIVPGL